MRSRRRRLSSRSFAGGLLRSGSCPTATFRTEGREQAVRVTSGRAKVKAKTVSVALSKEQFEAMREAISNWKALKAKLVRMEELSRLIIFGTTPDTRRDKRLTKATLGLGKRPKTA